MRERIRGVPAGLGALLAVSALLAVLWACLTPAFQAPDEQRHFTYVQSLAERSDLPGDPALPPFSTELADGMRAMNSDQVAAQRPVKPEWSQSIERAWATRQADAPRDDGGGPTPASTYPPVSYAWQALGYLAASSGSVFDQLLGARLMSALWLPITVLGTWLLAGELFGRRRLLQTAAAAVPALLPMVAFISASSSPDGMLYAVWSLALWVGVRCVKRGVPVREGAAFFALVGLACTVKTASYALLPAAGFVGLLGLLSRRPLRAGRIAPLAGAVVVPLAVTLGVWIVAAALLERPAAAQVTESANASAGTNWRELLSYVWQYYLPRIPGQNDYAIPSIGGGYPLLQVWITQAWGAFGWLEVRFPPWVYRILAVLTGGVFIAGAAALWRARRAVDLRVAAFLLLAFVALLVGLHWTDYHQIESGIGGFMQARYLFPVISLGGVVVAGALTLVPPRLRGPVTGAVLAFLLAFHVLALGLVLERFYA